MSPWLIMLILLSGQAAAPNPKTGAIRGLVTDTQGKPIPDVRISSSAARVPPVQTNADGAYELRDLPAGLHTIWPRKAGYGSPVSAPPKYVRLAADQQVNSLNFVLRRGATVKGTVMDIDKQPVRRAKLVAWRRSFDENRYVFRSSGSASTDDRGEYIFQGLPAGQYYLGVVPAAATVGKTNELRNVRGFYPSANSIESAALLTLNYEEEKVGIDLTLPRDQTYCVSTSFRDHEPAGGESIKLEEFGAGWQNIVAQGNAKTAEPIRICGFPRGTYRLSAVGMARDQTEPNRFAFQELAISKEDVKLSEIVLSGRKSVSGSVTYINAKPDEIAAQNVILSVFPSRRIASYEGESGTIVVKGSGGFEFPNLFEDRYRLRISGLRPGWFVKSASVGQTNLLEKDFPADGTPMELVISGGRPRVSGAVLDSDQRPAADAVVLLYSKNGGAPLRTFSDQNGQFEIPGGVAPGDYRLIAVTGLPDPESLDDPLIRALYDSKTEPLSLSNGEFRRITLKPTPAQ
jgi:protocatechuate 3,4-dioxygenase beta subunit